MEKTFSTAIVDNGNTYQLKVSINEAKKAGTLTYRNDDYILSNCLKSSVMGGIIYLMHIGQYIKLKTRLFVTAADNNKYITLLTGDTPHKYLLSEDKYTEFKTFEAGLQVPVSNIKKAENDTDDRWLAEWVPVTTKTHLSLYLGWLPPGDNDSARFLSISINGAEQSLQGAYYLPGKTGVVVPLGMFEQNAQYLAVWKCRAGHSGISKTVVGYFKNNDLNTRVVLNIKNNIDVFEEWDNAATINCK